MAAARSPASWYSSASISPTLSRPTGSSTSTPRATSKEKDEYRNFWANGWAAGSWPLANTHASSSLTRAWLPWVATQEPNNAAASTP
jgi:hypothetical protein